MNQFPLADVGVHSLLPLEQEQANYLDTTRDKGSKRLDFQFFH